MATDRFGVVTEATKVFMSGIKEMNSHPNLAKACLLRARTLATNNQVSAAELIETVSQLCFERCPTVD